MPQPETLRLATRRLRNRLWPLAAILVLGTAFGVQASKVWRAGATDAALMHELNMEPGAGNAFWTTLADTTFIAWLTARNAYTLTHAPGQLWDTEQCATGERTITLAEPLVTMGLIGIPFRLFTNEPILIFNLVTLSLYVLAAIGMYLLVAQWTNVPAAALMASLLYTFHWAQLAHVHHPFVRDLTWTIWGLYFGLRWLEQGRWVDAAGVAASGALQIGASLYPVLAAFFLTPPILIWLVATRGVRRIRPTQLILVAICITAAGLITYWPYLEARAASDTLRRPLLFYMPWSSLGPDSLSFPGWTVYGLAALALAPLPSIRWRGPVGDPRWVLLIGGVIVTFAAAGGNSWAMMLGESDLWLPNPYAWASAVLPGLDSIRGVRELWMGTQLALCLLSSIGLARLIGRIDSRRWKVAVGISGIAVVALEVFHIPVLGWPPRLETRAYDIGPDRELQSFFVELERRGNRGPILELPISRSSEFIVVDPPRILLSALHHRPTSACFGSYSWNYPKRREIAEIAASIPEPSSLDELAELGFTTVLVHRRGHRRGEGVRKELEVVATNDPSRLRRVHASDGWSAYELRPARQLR